MAQILAGYDVSARDPSLSLRDLLTVAFRRKRIAIAAVVLTTAFTGGGSYLKDPTYRAKAQVYVQRERPATVDLDDDRRGRPVLSRTDVINSEVNLILSRGVIERAVDNLQLWTRTTEPSLFQTICQPFKDLLVGIGMWTRVEPREGKILRLQQQLRVRGEPDADIISVSHASSNPKLSADIVNAVVDAYLRKRQDGYVTSERHQFFLAQLDRAETELDTLAEDRSAIKTEWNIVEIDQEKRLILDALTLTENRLQESLGDAREAEFTLVQLKTEIGALPERVLEATETERSELHDELTTMAARLEAQQAEQLVKWPPADPRVLEVTRALEAIQARLADVPPVTPSVERHTLNTLRMRLLEREKMVAASLAGLRGKLGEFKQQRDRQLERLLMLDARAEDLEKLDERIGTSRARRDLFLARAEEARVQTESGPNFANVWVINRASVPQRPTQMRLIVLAIGLGLGLALAGILVAIAEYFDHTIHNRDDVHRHLGVPVVAAVPYRRG